MSKTIIVVGFGPGISTAVAERFGKEGFQVALVARNAERLAAGVKSLTVQGIKAQAFTADVSDPSQARRVVAEVRKALGPITALEWNAYGSGAGNLLEADAAAMRSALDVATTSLLAAVQEALPDLKAQQGAVLVTNGGLGYPVQKMNAVSVQWQSMGLALANGAKHKLVGLLHEQLKAFGVYVGEVVVLNLVKGTAFDHGNATVDPAAVGERFWQLFTSRAEVTTQVG